MLVRQRRSQAFLDLFWNATSLEQVAHEISTHGAARHRKPCLAKGLLKRAELSNRPRCGHLPEKSMMKAALPLALVFAAGSALACPADSKSADAKAAVNSSATAAASAKTAPSKVNVVDKKAVKPVEAKKQTT